LLSGVGSSVFHPADYAILGGSLDPARLGRAFAFHTFTGNIGFAAAPPATAALMLLLGWRGALMFVGLLGIPVVLAIIWQSRILIDQRHRSRGRTDTAMSGAGLLLSRSVLMFFAFFMVSSMAGAGIQSWLITILHQVHGLPIAAASSALTGYMVGQIGGVLAGGWVADRTDRHLPFVVVLTIGAAALLLVVGVVSLAEAATIGVLFLCGLLTGASRTPRDVMVKDAAPPGQIGKVFGFGRRAAQPSRPSGSSGKQNFDGSADDRWSRPTRQSAPACRWAPRSCRSPTACSSTTDGLIWCWWTSPRCCYQGCCALATPVSRSLARRLRSPRNDALLFP